MDEIESLEGHSASLENAILRRRIAELEVENGRLKVELQVALEEVAAYQKEYPKAWATVEED